MPVSRVEANGSRTTVQSAGTLSGVAAETGVTVNAAGDLVIGDAVANDGTGNVILTSEGGAFDANATVDAADGEVSVPAATSVTGDAEVTASADILLQSLGGNTDINANVASTTGQMQILSGAALDVDGTLTSSGDMTLRSDAGGTTITAAVDSTAGHLTVVAAGPIGITATVEAALNLLLDAQAGDLAVSYTHLTLPTRFSV